SPGRLPLRARTRVLGAPACRARTAVQGAALDRARLRGPGARLLTFSADPQRPRGHPRVERLRQSSGAAAPGGGAGGRAKREWRPPRIPPTARKAAGPRRHFRRERERDVAEAPARAYGE